MFLTRIPIVNQVENFTAFVTSFLVVVAMFGTLYFAGKSLLSLVSWNKHDNIITESQPIDISESSDDESSVESAATAFPTTIKAQAYNQDIFKLWKFLFGKAASVFQACFTRFGSSTTTDDEDEEEEPNLLAILSQPFGSTALYCFIMIIFFGFALGIFSLCYIIEAPKWFVQVCFNGAATALKKLWLGIVSLCRTKLDTLRDQLFIFKANIWRAVVRLVLSLALTAVSLVCCVPIYVVIEFAPWKPLKRRTRRPKAQPPIIVETVAGFKAAHMGKEVFANAIDLFILDNHQGANSVHATAFGHCFKPLVLLNSKSTEAPTLSSTKSIPKSPSCGLPGLANLQIATGNHNLDDMVVEQVKTSSSVGPDCHDKDFHCRDVHHHHYYYHQCTNDAFAPTAGFEECVRRDRSHLAC